MPHATTRQLLLIKFCIILSERVYKETLDTVTQSFPQYVQELQGVADGSQVEFYKVSFRILGRTLHAKAIFNYANVLELHKL